MLNPEHRKRSSIALFGRLLCWRQFMLKFYNYLVIPLYGPCKKKKDQVQVCTDAQNAMSVCPLMPPFHQGLFSPIGPIWTRLSPINQSFNLPDGRPESPPIAQLFLTRLSPDYFNESSRLFCQLGKAMYQ